MTVEGTNRADEQLSLLGMEQGSEGPEELGGARIAYKDTSTILTRASGFMSDYDFTLNPYRGCAFGCPYCYAAFFTRDTAEQDSWGRWVEVKSNALAKLRRMRTPLEGARIYMSSVTDPYQPIERHLQLVRSLLEELVNLQPRLVVQTRSPLVTRDVDLLGQLRTVRVNMTVTTDDDEVRQAFEPRCSPIDERLRAIAEVHEAGLPASITMTPLLPVADPTSFAQRLLATGVTHFVVQPFHTGRSRFVAGTGKAALAMVEERSWTQERYRETVEVLRALLPTLDEGREGFAPA